MGNFKLRWGSIAQAILFSAAAIEPQRSLKLDRKSTRLNSSHGYISYAVFCLQKEHTAADDGVQPAIDQANAGTSVTLARVDISVDPCSLHDAHLSLLNLPRADTQLIDSSHDT